QELDGTQGIGGCGHGVGLEGSPGDLGHAYIVLHNPIADLVPNLEATPLHTLSLLVEICSTGDPFSRRRCDAPVQGLTGLPLAQGKHLARGYRPPYYPSSRSLSLTCRAAGPRKRH